MMHFLATLGVPPVSVDHHLLQNKLTGAQFFYFPSSHESFMPWHTIATVKTISDRSILFIKTKNYLLELLKLWNTNKDLKNFTNYFILSSDLLPFAQEHLFPLMQQGIVAAISNIDHIIYPISKLFYDALYQHVQTECDGRMLGNVSIHPMSKIAPNVFLGEHVVIEADVVIMPGCVISSYCKILQGSILFPHVTLYPFVQVGKFCRIHSGSVIGGDGFGYQFHQGEHQKIWHMGGVIIGHHVELGAGTCIDTGTFAPTVVGDGTKVDNQVQIAHNVEIGQHVIICGQSGVAGSSKVGNYSVLGGRVAVGPHVELGEQCQVAGGAMLTEKIWPAKSVLAGHPARPLKEWLKGVAVLRNLALTPNSSTPLKKSED